MGPGDTQALRPFPQFSNVTLINPSIGKSSYHGGFVRVEKRFADGFSLLAHYTKSRFMDDVESANEYGVTGQLYGPIPSAARLGAQRERRARSRRADRHYLIGGWRFSALENAPVWARHSP
jgi:hypothetical protein